MGETVEKIKVSGYPNSMKRVFKASDTITKRALEATKRALEAQSPGETVTRKQTEITAGIREKDIKPPSPDRASKAKIEPIKNKRAQTKTQPTCVKGAEGGDTKTHITCIKGNGLQDAGEGKTEKRGGELSVSNAIGPAAMADWNRQLAELCQETIKGAPKKLLLQKPSDLKLVDDLMRRANGVAGSNAGSSHPGHLVQINFLDSIGKERPENVRVTTSPFPQDVEE